MKKKKSKSKPKKEILQLYSAKDVVAKLCSASALNDIIKEHNKIIEDCIVKITNLYEDYRNNFLYRTQKIDFLIKESSLDEAGELLRQQNLELIEYSKRNEEQQILEYFSTKHKLLKEKNRKQFEESGIDEFIKYSNQKHGSHARRIRHRRVPQRRSCGPGRLPFFHPGFPDRGGGLLVLNPPVRGQLHRSRRGD